MGNFLGKFSYTFSIYNNSVEHFWTVAYLNMLLFPIKKLDKFPGLILNYKTYTIKLQDDALKEWRKGHMLNTIFDIYVVEKGKDEGVFFIFSKKTLII